MKTLLQVISTCPQDSRAIHSAGADRIELVSALQIGGLTPSAALLRKSLEITEIPTMVMVRHHNQGFVLSKDEKQLLIEQSLSLCDLGAKGIVVGAITSDNKVDQDFIKKLKGQLSNKIDVTFHKASDLTNLPQTYKVLQFLGINRVLTQGGKGPIMQNKEVIHELLKVEKINTLLGGGISQNNIKQIVQEFKPAEVHIGTCVRKDKYGFVQGQLVQQFIEKMRSA